jgi:diguanylate cyclase (GGDEF)-like protein
MTKMNLSAMPDATLTERIGNIPAQEGAENPVYGHLQHCLSELGELRQALATSQHQLKASQLQIETLLGNKTCLRQKLIRLAKKYAHARHFGYHDELTGLPNRSLLLDRLKQAIVQSARQQKQVALLFIDLDKFKNVNDSLGHAAGDKLLQLVAERLTACIRYGDTACRYGGDEFVIMLPEIENQESLSVVTEKIRSNLAAFYELDGNVIKVTASIGTAVYSNDGQDYSDLIKQADNAMYLAKTHSELQKRSFEPAMQN